jgi:hypothetical protein
MDKVVIQVGRQLDGYTFRLDPRSRAEIAESLPKPLPATSVFVSFETREGLERVYGPMWQQVAILLTGLSEAQLGNLGGSVFIDAANGQALFESGKRNV